MHNKIAVVFFVAAICIAAGAAQPANGQARFLGPVISSIAPQAPPRRAAAQLVTITGVNFHEGLSLTVVEPDGRKLKYAGTAIQTRRDTSFTVSIVLAAQGAYTLIVTNPDGAASDPFVLKAQPSTSSGAAAVAPKIERVAPEQVTKDPQPQVLAVTGDHFVAGLSVYLTDPIGTVYLINGTAVGSVTTTSLTVSVTIEMTGDYILTVTNPSGQSSNTVTIKAVMKTR